MYKKEYVLSVSDVDAFSNLKLSSLMVMMQDVATDHAESSGIGQSKIIKEEMFWVISRYSISIKRLPRYQDRIFVCTYPGDDMKFMFPRYFKIMDENGDILIQASSLWLVLNKEDHRVNLNPFNGFVLPSEHYEGEEPLPEKISNDDKEFVEKRVVRFNDVDFNKHLNNTKYIEYIVDSHDYDFYKHHDIKHIVINYNKEIKYGDVVSLYSNKSNPEVISGDINENNSFVAKIIFEDK